MSGASGRSGRPRRAVVVGAGLAGLMVAHELARRGQPVLLLSLAPAARARSGSVTGGIAAAVEPRLDGDEPAKHLDDTLRAGAFAAPVPAVQAMVEAAPGLVQRLARAGVPFLRTSTGLFARFGSSGSQHRRLLLAGATTGRQVLGVLDDQVRRWESIEARDPRGLRWAGEPMIRRLEQLDLLALVRNDDGRVVGVVTQDRRTLRCVAHPADGVCLATGSAAGLLVPGLRGASASGSGIAIAARAGAVLAGFEAIAAHPTVVASADGGFRLLDGLLEEGARLWCPARPGDERPAGAIPEDERNPLDLRAAVARGEPGAATARRLAALGVRPPDAVGDRSAFAEVGAIDPETWSARFAPLLEGTEVDRDDAGRPIRLRVFPEVCDALGGLWVDHQPSTAGALAEDSPRNHATSLPGLYAAGGCAALYHGAGLLGGNRLLATLFGGERAAAAMASYRASLGRSALDLSGSRFERAEAAATAARDALLERGDSTATESHASLRRELAGIVRSAVSPGAPVSALDAAQEAVAELRERAQSARVADRAIAWNASLEQARHLDHLLVLAPVLLAAVARQRGSATRGNQPPRHRSLARADDGELRFVERFSYHSVGREITVSAESDPTLVGGTTVSSSPPARDGASQPPQGGTPT